MGLILVQICGTASARNQRVSLLWKYMCEHGLTVTDVMGHSTPAIRYKVYLNVKMLLLFETVQLFDN